MVRRNRPKLAETIDLSGRDEQADREVAAILAELPADHPARQAFAERRDTIALTHLVAARKDLVKRLVDTYFAHDGTHLRQALLEDRLGGTRASEPQLSTK